MKKEKETPKNKTKESKIVFADNLPQNIISMGEKNDEDKNIYISQTAYKSIHDFTKNKLTNESGGMLIGNVIEEFGKKNIIIYGFIEAKYCEATPTTLTFTHETWEYVHEQMELQYEKGQIIGWIHTHPSFGIFLSEYDKFIQNNFFNEDYQIAYVVDPIQHIEGFFFWINGKIEKCKGFYIFDKTGVPIKIEEEKEETPAENSDNKSATRLKINVINYILLVAFAIVLFITLLWGNNIKNRMNSLEKEQDNLSYSSSQTIEKLQKKITELEQKSASLSSKNSSLEKDLEKLESKISDMCETEEVVCTETETSEEITESTEDESLVDETNEKETIEEIESTTEYEIETETITEIETTEEIVYSFSFDEIFDEEDSAKEGHEMVSGIITAYDADNNQVWSVKTIESCPAVNLIKLIEVGDMDYGYLYCVNDSLVCLNKADGSIIWECQSDKLWISKMDEEGLAVLDFDYDYALSLAQGQISVV